MLCVSLVHEGNQHRRMASSLVPSPGLVFKGRYSGQSLTQSINSTASHFSSSLVYLETFYVLCLLSPRILFLERDELCHNPKWFFFPSFSFVSN